MDEKSIWLAIVSSVITLLGKIVFDWLGNGKRSGNGSAGQKDVAFWLLEYKNSADRVIKELREHVDESEDRLLRAIETRRRTRGD